MNNPQHPGFVRRLLQGWAIILRNEPPMSIEQTVACLFLFFLGFIFYQATFWHIQSEGYFPYRGDLHIYTYAFRGVLAFFLFFGLFLTLLPRRLPALLFLACVFYVAWFYAAEHSRLPHFQQGNDRVEALQVTIENLLRGKFPYRQEEPFRCGPITPLTTCILLALPAQLLCGRPELTTFPLLLLVFLALAWHRWRRGSPFPLEVLLCLIFLNPVVLHELHWGSDLLWGGVLLTLGLILLEHRFFRCAAVCFGLALCTRSALLSLIPLLGVYIFRRQRPAFRGGAAIVAGIVLLLELPLIVWDADFFFNQAPLGMSKYLLQRQNPAGDQIFSDLALELFPTGKARPYTCTALYLAVAALCGLAARNTAQLAVLSAGLMTLMLFFMGQYLLRDYFAWVVLPLVFVLAGNAPPRTGGDADTEPPRWPV